MSARFFDSSIEPLNPIAVIQASKDTTMANVPSNPNVAISNGILSLSSCSQLRVGWATLSHTISSISSIYICM